MGDSKLMSNSIMCKYTSQRAGIMAYILQVELRNWLPLPTLLVSAVVILVCQSCMNLFETILQLNVAVPESNVNDFCRASRAGYIGSSGAAAFLLRAGN